MEEKNICSREKSVFSNICTEIVDEDEEVEKFFALVRKMKNLQQSNNDNNNNNNNRKKEKRKRATSNSGPGGWAPAFQWEDFTAEIEFKKHGVPMSNPPSPSDSN